MLKTTKFDIQFHPGPMFIEQCVKMMKEDVKVQYYANFLLEFANYESDWIIKQSYPIPHNPIYQAAACYSLSKYTQKEGASPWPKYLSDVFDISVKDFLDELVWVYQEYECYKKDKENIIYQKYCQVEFQNVANVSSMAVLNLCYKTNELYFHDDPSHVPPCYCQPPI